MLKLGAEAWSPLSSELISAKGRRIGIFLFETFASKANLHTVSKFLSRDSAARWAESWVLSGLRVGRQSIREERARVTCVRA